MVASTLSAKAALFAEEFSIDGNGTAAAIRAGYAPISAPVTASRLIRNHKVKAVLAARQKSLAAHFDLDRQCLVNELLRAADLAKAQGAPAGMVAAYREIGRLCGFYAPEKWAGVGFVADQAGLQALEAMSDEELVAIMAWGAQRGVISASP